MSGGVTPEVLALQQKQIQYNGRITMSLMNRVEPRGRLVVSGKPVPLKYDAVCSNMEAKVEIPKGGYILSTEVSNEEIDGTVVDEAQLPSFTKESKDAEESFGPVIRESRLHVCPMELINFANRARGNAGSDVPVLVSCSEESIMGGMTLVALGELPIPIPLKKLTSFYVEWSYRDVQWYKAGPFSKQEIGKTFRDDCRTRKRFVKEGGTIDGNLLMSPFSVGIHSGEDKFSFRLVRHNGQTCLLGVVFAMQVNVGDLRDQVECCFCLEDCPASEWSCVNCKNVMHHACRQSLLDTGCSACPYCRFDV